MMNTDRMLKQYHDKIIKVGSLQVHRITHHIVDIFHATGWEICSRYRFRKDRGHWEHVSGPKLSIADQKEVLRG